LKKRLKKFLGHKIRKGKDQKNERKKGIF
jgi:hypothetical protein